MPIGPEIPAHLLAGTSGSVGPSLTVSEPKTVSPAEDSDSAEEYAPALPPHLRPAKKVIGPTLPSSAPAISHQNNEDSDDDDDFGPQPLPSGGATVEKVDAVKEFIEREERRRLNAQEDAKPKALKRDEWMLTPPTNDGVFSVKDTTKMKARTFQKNSGPPKGKQENNLWTETPAERAQRLADEVNGVKRRATAAVELSPEEEALQRKRQKRDEQIRQGVDAHTRSQRGAALVEAHEAKNKDSDKSDEQDKGIWDHARDMGVNGRLMDDGQRRKMLNDAKGLSSRFGAGSSGGFL